MNAGNKTIWLQYAVSSLTMGLVPIGIKLVDSNPISIGIIRLSLAICCFVVLPKTFKHLKKIKTKDILPLISLGLLFFIHWVSYFYSIKISSPVTAVLGLSTYGIHLLVLSVIFQGRRVRKVDLLALLLALLGVIIIVPEFSLSNETFLGFIVAVVSSSFFASLPIIHQANKHIDDNLRCFFMLIGAISFFLISTLLIDSPFFSFKASTSDWAWFLFLGIGGTFISHLLWTKVSSFFPSNLTSILYYGFIPFAMFFSWLVLGKVTVISEIIGGSMIIIGGLIAINDFRKQNKLSNTNS